ncbi:MAG: aminotransferase class IV [Rhodospirillaceae bacterium]|nr:aminotransferase class IV [Rhodospirillaceae bacterium]
MIWLNGQLLPPDQARIDPRDRGFTLGDGLFETLAARDGTPVALADHLERMARACTVLDLPLPVEASEVPAAIAALLAANHLTRGPAAMRLTLSRGVGSRGLLLPLDPKPVLVMTASAHPPVPGHLDADVVAIRRNEGSPLSRIKSLNYLDNVLAQQEAQARGADEGLMLNNAGRVAGFARGNLFLLRGERLLTPPLVDGVLDGIVRHKILLNAGEIGLQAVEHSLERADLDAAEALYITNSLLGCVPIRRLNGRDMPQNPDLASRLAALLAE